MFRSDSNGLCTNLGAIISVCVFMHTFWSYIKCVCVYMYRGCSKSMLTCVRAVVSMCLTTGDSAVFVLPSGSQSQQHLHAHLPPRDSSCQAGQCLGLYNHPIVSPHWNEICKCIIPSTLQPFFVISDSLPFYEKRPQLWTEILSQATPWIKNEKIEDKTWRQKVKKEDMFGTVYVQKRY